MRVEVFKPFHVDLLRAQGVQSAQLREVSHVPQVYETMNRGLTAFDGEWVILCGGIIPVASRRGICWALLSERAGKHMVWLDRAVRRFLTIHDWQRLEATVEEGFPAGCRWLELLGFSYEGHMRKFGNDGETHLRYSRIK